MSTLWGTMMYQQLNDSIDSWTGYQQVPNLEMRLSSTQMEPSRATIGLNINSPTTPYGDTHLARMRLTSEFNNALENTQSRGGLESTAFELIQSLGFTGYAFMGLDFDSSTGKISPPNRYLTTHSSSVYRGCVAQLHCALRQRANIQLSSLYHWEEKIGVNPDGSSIRWGCYVLITGTGNYGYLLPGGSFSNNHKVALSVMSEELNPDEFRDHVERSQLALDVLARAIDKTGQNICPELFLEGRDMGFYR